jgi:pimeloyl-ACP methyl ester carboxylesterase
MRVQSDHFHPEPATRLGCSAMPKPLVSVLFALLSAGLSACSSTLVPYDPTATPVISLPLTTAGISDSRGRFREIFCAVLEARKDTVPDYEPCDSALTTVGTEPAGTGEPVALDDARTPLFAGVVEGIGWSCFREWLEPPGSVTNHVRRFGYDAEIVDVDALSGSDNNAGQVRDWVLEFSAAQPDRDLILIGYSKGTSDILVALVDYPEIVEHVTAVVSVAGSVGGSPLALDATQNQLEMLTHWPGAACDEGDGRGLESLTPAVRQAWLASNSLPSDIPYYSVVTFPDPDRISNLLEHGYNMLARIDARNDSQVISDDQIIPGSTLVAFLNADHWAIALPVARSHSTIGRTFVNHNNYPREALLESILRFVEEDLAQASVAPGAE